MNWTGNPETGYRITPRARQRNRYLKSLEARFIWLADNPRAGKHRIDIAHDYYSFPHGRHVVFYLVAGNMIDIIGVPHQEMDVIVYFDTDV